MKDIKIDSTSGLESFLRILAEESVEKSKNTINGLAALNENTDSYYKSEKDYQEELANRIKVDTGRFSEADDEIDDEDSEEAEATQDPEPEPSSEEQSVDYYTIRDKINLIRAGESTKDSDIATPLEKYIMSDLDADEREAMHMFLSSVADIMNRTGDPADPSDPPTSIVIKKKSEQQPSEKSSSSAGEDRNRPRPVSVSTGAEDISPPIKVGGQVKETLRAKVKELMRG